jgi:hypothetical protein
MNTKKVRVQLTYICTLLYFVAFQVIEAADTGEKATFFEALAVAMLVFGLLYIAFSDWLYHTQLVDKGLKLKYSTFQNIGLITVIIFISIIFTATYNNLYDDNLGIYSPSFYILVGAIYLLAVLFGSKNRKEKNDV